MSFQSTGWDTLTSAELRVARAVSQGLTNAEAGQRLYLSRHTVDFHLRQIFRKLQIHSRVALARLVIEVDMRDSEVLDLRDGVSLATA
jgi:DNA-binding CsgD family transcriptional regulator